MSIATLTVPALVPFQNFWRWLGTSRTPARYAVPAVRATSSPAFLRQHAMTGRAAIQRVSERMSDHPSPHKALPPVRMVRMLESGQPRSSVGRMVISGRMADVCAELDRLANAVS